MSEIVLIQGRWKDKVGNSWTVRNHTAEAVLLDSGQVQNHAIGESENGRAQLIDAVILFVKGGQVGWSDGDIWTSCDPSMHPGFTEEKNVSPERRRPVPYHQITDSGPRLPLFTNGRLSSPSKKSHRYEDPNGRISPGRSPRLSRNSHQSSRKDTKQASYHQREIRKPRQQSAPSQQRYESTRLQQLQSTDRTQRQWESQSSASQRQSEPPSVDRRRPQPEPPSDRRKPQPVDYQSESQSVNRSQRRELSPPPRSESRTRDKPEHKLMESRSFAGSPIPQPVIVDVAVSPIREDRPILKDSASTTTQIQTFHESQQTSRGPSPASRACSPISYTPQLFETRNIIISPHEREKSPPPPRPPPQPPSPPLLFATTSSSQLFRPEVEVEVMVSPEPPNQLSRANEMMLLKDLEEKENLISSLKTRLDAQSVLIKTLQEEKAIALRQAAALRNATASVRTTTPTVRVRHSPEPPLQRIPPVHRIAPIPISVPAPLTSPPVAVHSALENILRSPFPEHPPILIPEPLPAVITTTVLHPSPTLLHTSATPTPASARSISPPRRLKSESFNYLTMSMSPTGGARHSPLRM